MRLKGVLASENQLTAGLIEAFQIAVQRSQWILDVIYNRDLVYVDEIAGTGTRIAGIGPRILVTAFDYSPVFRRRDLVETIVEEMLKIKQVLETMDCRQ